jgi:RES domain-containing protein
MIDIETLIDRLRKVQLVGFEGLVYRCLPAKYASVVLSTVGSFKFGGRYNAQGEFGVLYTSDHPETCRAERLRLVKEQELLKNHVIAGITLRCTRVLDLTDPTIRRALGVSKKDLVGDSLTLTQTLGHLAKGLGMEALRVPSAAGAGANVVVYVDNLGPGSVIAVQEVTEAWPEETE